MAENAFFKLVEGPGTSVYLRVDRQTGEFHFSLHRGGKKVKDARYKINELLAKLGIKPAAAVVEKKSLGQMLLATRQKDESCNAEHYSRAAVAKRAGISSDSLRRLECDLNKKPDPEVVKRVLAAMEIKEEAWPRYLQAMEA